MVSSIVAGVQSRIRIALNIESKASFQDLSESKGSDGSTVVFLGVSRGSGVGKDTNRFLVIFGFLCVKRGRSKVRRVLYRYGVLCLGASPKSAPSAAYLGTGYLYREDHDVVKFALVAFLHVQDCPVSTACGMIPNNLFLSLREVGVYAVLSDAVKVSLVRGMI